MMTIQESANHSKHFRERNVYRRSITLLGAIWLPLVAASLAHAQERIESLSEPNATVYSNYKISNASFNTSHVEIAAKNDFASNVNSISIFPSSPVENSPDNPSGGDSQQALLLLPPTACTSPAMVGMLSACLAPIPVRFEDPPATLEFKPVPPGQPIRPLEAGQPTSQKFHWSAALWQSFGFLVFEHAFRLANDEYARYLLFHKPFWHDYAASANHFHMSRWGDGDSFLVNYIGHPMEGAVAGDIFLNNDPRGRAARFGKSSTYWYSRLKAMAWATVFSAYFEIGPVFSETAIGNEGGYTYYPGCGAYPCAHEHGKHYKPPTNNTGWVDFVITPTVGMGWIVMEDVIETEFVDRIAKDSPALKYKMLRSALAPSHTLANAFAGKTPWFRYPAEGSFEATFGAPLHPVTERPLWKNEPRFSTSVQFVSMNLPMDSENCSNCRKYFPGAGVNFSYRFAKYAYVDTVVNIFPGSGSYGKHGAAQEGLIGLKVGKTDHSWGIFGNLHGGTIHYDKTLVPGSATVYESTYRFALDLGGTVEYYASRNSTLRFNAGSTFVHYLTGYADPEQRPENVLSDKYFSFNGNFYLSTGYVFRF